MADGSIYAHNPCQYLDVFGCHFSVMMWRVISPLFLLVGISGNCISFLVFSRKRMCDTTASVYLRFLSVFDSLVLLTSVLRHMIRNYTYMELRKFSDFTCRLLVWVSSSSRQVAIWLLCVIAIDRMLLIKYPIWAKTNCTKRRSIYIALAIATALFIMDSPTFMFYHRKELFIYSNVTNNSVLTGYMCTHSSEAFKYFSTKIKSVLILLLFSIGPVICLTYCNIILLRELNLRHQKKQIRRVNIAIKVKEELELRSVTKMLVTVCIFFIIITVPGCIYLVIEPYILDRKISSDASISMMFHAILGCLLYSNNTFNFILYCVSGKLFRKELQEMLKGVRFMVLKRIIRNVEPLDDTGVRNESGSIKERTDTLAGTSTKSCFITDLENADSTKKRKDRKETDV